MLAIVGGIVGKPPAEQSDAAGGSAVPTTGAPATVDAPPPAVAQAPPPAPVEVVKPRPTSLSQIDAALSPAQKRDYALRLQAVAPSTQAEFDKHPGDVDTAAKYLARNGVQLCNTIASGEPDDVVTRQTVSRFEIDAKDAPAVRSTTEQMVCAQLA